MALEELEMALRREEQERSQRINAETLLSNRLDLNVPFLFLGYFSVFLDCSFFMNSECFHFAYKKLELYPTSSVFGEKASNQFQTGKWKYNRIWRNRV